MKKIILAMMGAALAAAPALAQHGDHGDHGGPRDGRGFGGDHRGGYAFRGGDRGHDFRGFRDGGRYGYYRGGDRGYDRGYHRGYRHHWRGRPAYYGYAAPYGYATPYAAAYGYGDGYANGYYEQSYVAAPPPSRFIRTSVVEERVVVRHVNSPRRVTHTRHTTRHHVAKCGCKS